MTTALFSPPCYTGEFATISLTRNCYQVTLWQFGQAKRYTLHEKIFDAVLEVVAGGFNWGSEKMKAMFEEDVIMAGEV